MAFAVSNDVKVRLGRVLTSDEIALVDQIIASVTGLIAEAVDRDDAWAAALAPVPKTLKVLCIEKALAAVVNPTALLSVSEQLGAYQHSDTFQRPENGATVGVFLSGDERRRVRRAIYGTNVTTGRMESVITPAFPIEADGDPLTPI